MAGVARGGLLLWEGGRGGSNSGLFKARGAADMVADDVELDHELGHDGLEGFSPVCSLV